MREVTDPNILAQLNGNSVHSREMNEVTDPNILAQLNGSSTGSTQNISSIFDSPTTLNSVVNSPGVQGILGAGDALRNTVATGGNAIANLLGGYAPQLATANTTNNSSPIAQGLGNITGNVLGFMGGGEIADTARFGAEALPYVGKLAQMLGGSSMGSTMARQGLGSGLYGALATDQDRSDNAIKGGVLGATAASVPFGVGKIEQGLNYLQPQKYAKQILDNLSGGQSLGDATQSVLATVKNAYKQQQENASELYNGVRSNIPSGSIYAPVKRTLAGTPDVSPTNVSLVSRSYSPLPGQTNEGLDPTIFGNVFSHTEDAGKNISSSLYSSGKQNPASFLSGSYPSLPENITDNYTSSLKDMHNDFINNPTFQNAHALQSELGAVSRQLQSGRMAPTIDTLNSANSLSNARNSLKSDMDTYLRAQNPELADQYQKAAENFQENVVPYRSNPKLYSIATGDTTNITPSALSTIFKAPDEDMQKVINDLPSGTMDKVLYTQLGKDTPSNNPFAFARAYGRLNEQGLGQYISPELQQNLESLQNRIKYRSLAQSAAGGLTAAAHGASHGAGGAVGLGMMGAALGSPIMNYLGRRLPLDQIGSALTAAGGATYPYLYKTAISNLLNNTGGQQ